MLAAPISGSLVEHQAGLAKSRLTLFHDLAYLSKMQNPLPQFLQPLFWEFDITKFDKNQSKWTIIERIINHGSAVHLKWLFDTYTLAEIGEHITKNYNLSVYAVKLWASVLNINPDQCKCMRKPSLVRAFF